jgi:hypothetical protein
LLAFGLGGVFQMAWHEQERESIAVRLSLVAAW